MLFVADRFFLESQSANRARLNRQPSLRHSVEMTDRGPPLVLSNRGENAQTGHDVYVDNIGIVSDQFSQVHVAVDESKQDFDKGRLMLHQISVRSESGIRKGLRCFLKRRRVAK